MKKLFIAALAVSAFTACSQEEIVEQQLSSAITFENAFVDNATRAAQDPSITKDNIDAFDVWGFMNETGGVVFEQQRVTKQGDEWTYSPLQYWIPGNKYYFGALAPVVDKNWTLNTGNANTYGIGEVSFTNVDGTEDLLYAGVAMSTEGKNVSECTETVKLTFNHLLSKVKFTFTNGFDAPNYTIDVKNIKMTVPAEGKINLAQADWWSTNKWELIGDKTTVLNFGNMDATGVLVTKGAECQYERLTIPTSADGYDYIVTFDVALYVGSALAYSNTLSTVIDNAALEMGKAYNFHATLDHTNIAGDELKPIVFEVVEVKEWVDGNGYDGGLIDTEVSGIVSVASASDFNAAIAAGATNFQLSKDIEGTLTFGQESRSVVKYVLDLNGKTIKSTGDAIDICAGELDIVGEGEVIAATENTSKWCAVWAHGTALVNIYGGTYKIGHAEGDYNDLIYAKENAKINIYGGTYYNSGRDNAFVLNLKDADRETAAINVYGGTYEKFDPANNKSENPAKSFVANGYTSKQAGNWFTVVPATSSKEVKTADELFQAVNEGADITLGANITISSTLVVEAGKVINLNLGNFTLNNKVDNAATDVIIVKSGATLTIEGEGIVEAVSGNDGYAVISEGILHINGGTFKAGVDANAAPNAVIYARGKGEVYVSGGKFPNANNSRYVLNKKDADKATTIISVTGGEFTNFNPAASLSENPQANFVAEGYTVTEANGVYTVVAE